MTRHRKNNSQKRAARSRRGAQRGTTSPTNLQTVVVKTLTGVSPSIQNQYSFKVNELLNGMNNTYAYRLTSLRVSVAIPREITVGEHSGGQWVNPVVYSHAQLCGYMIQGDTLQRLPMTSKLEIRPGSERTLSARDIQRNIYVGGMVPVTILNQDSVFCLLFTYYTQHVLPTTSEHPNFTIVVHSQWKASYDIAVHSSVSGVDVLDDNIPLKEESEEEDIVVVHRGKQVHSVARDMRKPMSWGSMESIQGARKTTP